MPELVIWKIRPATLREKRDALLPQKADVNALLDHRGVCFAIATRTGVVLWVSTAIDRAYAAEYGHPQRVTFLWAQVEALLNDRALRPLTADHDLTKLPEHPKAKRRSRWKLRHTRLLGFKYERKD